MAKDYSKLGKNDLLKIIEGLNLTKSMGLSGKKSLKKWSRCARRNTVLKVAKEKK
jgi:hypothetical protein